MEDKTMTTRKTLGILAMLCFFCGVVPRQHNEWLNWWEGSNLTHWVLPQVIGYERWFK